MVLDRFKARPFSKKVETGWLGFDKISGGGIPRPAAIALIGDVDGGKELLIRNIVWNLLQKGSKVLYYSVSQSAEELRYELLSYNWDVKLYEANGTLRIVDIFTEATKRMSKELAKDLNLDEISEISFHKNVYDLKKIYDEGMKFIPVLSRSPPFRIAIFDSISPLFSTNTKGVFQMIHTLKFATRLSKATGVGLMHSGVHDTKTEENFKSLADVIIEVNRMGKGSSHYISLLKYPGKHQKGPFPIEINEAGIEIIPIPMPEFV